MHDCLIAEHGGHAGVRDEGLLKSALVRPRQLLAYSDLDLALLAATYVTGIIRNHPFIDGNKCTGFMMGYVFLGRNGLRLTAPEAETTQVILSLAAGTLSEDAFAAWIRDNTE